MSVSQKHTTSRGVCPEAVSERCDDFCDVVQACVELERGECFLTIAGDEVQRTLFNYRIRIQNCSDGDISFNAPELSLVDRLIAVSTDGSRTETPVTLFHAANSVATIAGPTYKTLALSSTCGKHNSSAFYAGLDGDASTALLTGSVVIPPGECCLNLVVAVDAVAEDAVSFPELFPEIIAESGCLELSGRVVRGNACCSFARSLIVPGECALRSLRNTHDSVSI